jgi:hypothetical protein
VSGTLTPRRVSLVALLVISVVLAGAGTAFAFWTGAGSGSAVATGDFIPRGQTPTTSVTPANSPTVNVSFNRVSTTGAAAITAYLVTRYNASTSTFASVGGCTVGATTVTCADTPGDGSWQYTDTPFIAGTSWTGQESPKSSAVTVDTAPALTSMVMQDTNSNGKIDHVVVTFSGALASSTATAPWTLTNVPSGGSLASVSTSGTTATLVLTEGAGAADTSVGTFKVALAASATGIRDAAGNQSSFAATAPADGAGPLKTAIEMLDANGNGKVDRVRVTYSESVVPVSPATTAKWTLANVPSAGSIDTVSAIAGSGSAQILVPVNEGAGAADTSVGSFTVASATGAVADAAGNNSIAFTAGAPTDKAAPARASMVMQDSNADGKIDRVAVSYSESLASSPTGTWALANVPSSGTLGTATISGNQVLVGINPGAGAADTSVGSFTVALTANAPKDAAGNTAATFVATAPTDGAGPVLVLITNGPGTTAGLMQAGNSLTLVFSEALQASTVPSSVAVKEERAGPSTFTMPGLTVSASISNNYLGANSSFGSATGTVTVSADRKSVTVTLGPITTSGSGVAPGTAGVNIAPAAALQDPSGNSAPNTTASVTPLF